MRKNAHTVIFTHIPKTAGVTMHTILHREYILKWGNIFYSANFRKIDTIRALSQRFRDNLMLIKGHLYFGAHAYLPRQADYITILREPLERTVSEYNHLCVSPRTLYYKILNEKQYSLDDLFDNGIIINMDNCQVRFLCGARDIPFGEVGDEHLQMALHNLEQYYYKRGVGITERFDESLLLFAKKCGWKNPWYVKQNVQTKQRTRLAELSNETMERLKHFNRFDEILYLRAKELFEQDVKDEGPDFAQEVAVFRKRNERRANRTRIITWIFMQLYWLRFYTGTQKE